MRVSDALRRIKRQFGDEYNVVITDQDIYDWIHDSELDIIRATSDNDVTLPIPISKFPLQIPDRVNIKRLSVNNKALMNISLAQLDLAESPPNVAGSLAYWYYQGGMAYLWPTPDTDNTDTVDVTYARTPSQMTVVAPYLQYIAGASVAQAGTVVSDNDWKNSTSVNMYLEIAVDTLIHDAVIMSVGADQTPVNNHFFVEYVAPSSFRLTVSNGSVLSPHLLTMTKPFAAGEFLSLRITFNPATDTAYLYRINPFTGQSALQSSDTANRVWNKQIAATADLFIGNTSMTNVVGNLLVGRIYGIELRAAYSTEPTGPPIVFVYDGMNDLGNLFGVAASFVTSSAHTLTTTGGIVVPAANEFTVPEVFHEDVVKFCLARAHVKNQNFRAAESEMEQYDRRVSTRRNEAQAPETALYKIPDPSDYEDYVQ